MFHFIIIKYFILFITFIKKKITLPKEPKNIISITRQGRRNTQRRSNKIKTESKQFTTHIKLQKSVKKPSNKNQLRRKPLGNIQTIPDNKNKQKFEASKSKPDTDYELNWLSYEEAIIFDKRSNCDYYCALIRCKQLFIFTFCSFNDYNSGIVKKFMFFLSFALHYTINALFFDESTMHQIYEDKGKFNFAYQITHILYSAITATFILRLMLQTLVLTDKDILEVKLQSTKNLAFNMKKNKLKCIKIKFAIFFIFNFILLGLFWYYLTCFNAIYENTQVYLIENTFISFAFSLFYPFIINIFPTMIRMSSIHSSNKDQKCCYKVSQIIQII